MIKLSVVIITFNEEKNIGRCLEGIQLLADEIIIVDSFSTDKTKEICLAYKNVRFFEKNWEGYSAQKNWANAQASYNFILSIDADETPDETLLKNILEVKKNPNADAYTFNRCTNYCGAWIKHGAWYPDKKLRLWNRNKGHWNDAIVHEEIAMQNNVKINHLLGDLLHYSYYTIEEHILQGNKFSTIAAQEAFQNAKKTNFIQLIVSPLWRFWRDYFFKMGFLDGWAGFIIAINTSHTTFLKYIKLRNLHKKKD